jgi:hypothetical protein
MHLLWAAGNAEAAIQMEKLGNQLTKIHDVDILCGCSVNIVGLDGRCLPSNLCRTFTCLFAIASAASSNQPLFEHGLAEAEHEHGCWFHPSALTESQSSHSPAELVRAYW